jgi:hypothetical protein
MTRASFWPMTTSTPSEPTRLYTRRLPSGGYVAIEALPVRTLFGPVKIRGHVVVERRPESRRQGHRAPIAACAEYTRAEEIVDALVPIASSDSVIADVLARKVMVPVAVRPKHQLS